MIQLGHFFYLQTFAKSKMTFCTLTFMSKDFSVKMEIILKTKSKFKLLSGSKLNPKYMQGKNILKIF